MSELDLDQLVQRIDDLEQRLEQKDERIDALEERVEELEDRTPIEDVQKRASQLEGRVDDLERQSDPAGEPQDPAALEDDAPPIYDVLRTPRQRLEGTERRTHFLWSDLGDYASSTPKGYVLQASDVRRVLEAAEPDESDCSRITANHVGRVFDLSVDLTRGAAFVRKNDEGERQLVVPRGWEDEARAAAGGDNAVVS